MNKKALVLAAFLSLFSAFSSFVCARTVLTPGVLFEAESQDPALDHTGGSYNMPGLLSFWGKGYVRLTLSVAEHGYYKLLIRAAADPCAGGWPLLEAQDTHYRIFSWDVDAPRNAPVVLVSVPLELRPGTMDLDLKYENDAYQPPEDRNLFLDWLLLVKVPSPEADPDPNMLVKGQPLSTYGQLRQAVFKKTNLLSDPDFEKSTVGWYIYKASGEDGTYTVNFRDTEAPKFGNHCASIEVTDPGTTIKLVGSGFWLAPVEANVDLVYSGWAKKTAGTTAKARVEFLCYSDQASTYKGIVWKVINFSVTDEWQYFQFTFKASEVPSGTLYVLPTLVALEGTGKIFYDGTSLYPAYLEVPASEFPLAAEHINGKIRLAWEAQEDNFLYEIHRGSAPDFLLTDSTKVAVAETNEWVDENPDLAVLAYYKVRSINDLFAARESIAVVNDLLPPNPLPEAPRVSNELGGILIVSWQAPQAALDGERAAKYLIYRAQNSADVGKGDPVAIIYEDPAKESFVWRDRDVVPGQAYYYAIQCEDRVGNRNELSAIVGPIVPNPDELPPLAPVNLQISPALRGALTLTWTRPAPAADDDLPEEYYILRSRESHPDLEEVLEVNPELLTELRIAVVQANGAVNLKYVDPQVVPGETYYYHVLSVDKARNWKCSVEVSATVLEAAVPVASSPQAPDVVANQPVTFSWQAPVLDYDDQVATYTLEYAYTADFSDAVSIANIAQTQFTLSAQEVLAPGTVYWRVRAHYLSGVIGGFSAPVSFDVVEVGNASFPVPYFNLLPRIVKARENIVATYVLDRDGWVTVEIYDSRGKLVRLLVPRQWQLAKNGGEHNVHKLIWDGCDEQGRQLVDGLYIGKLILERPDQRPLVLYRRFQVYRTH